MECLLFHRGSISQKNKAREGLSRYVNLFDTTSNKEGTLVIPSLSLWLQRSQQLGLNLQLRFVLLQSSAVNQKGIFDAFAQGADLGQ